MVEFNSDEAKALVSRRVQEWMSDNPGVVDSLKELVKFGQQQTGYKHLCRELLKTAPIKITKPKKTKVVEKEED